ncbi:hypothetical protein [Pseudanabaena sp. UWO310]|uniref:hypothetical protein n=1 Tax=Pseudanabaena sp. UWO310 TaxID=2480795 RepID=UPI00115BC0F0|nr:hypothetical protein [Pseudanabaena sp. UWO310]TYQ29980.1 hypothetical protein PseudUWO310_11205 [Pseudanabaena sp. UWO310]
MSKYEHYPQAIEGFVDFAHSMFEVLDALLANLIGDEARWSNNIGTDPIPKRFLKNDLNDQTFIKLWQLRAEASSLLLIEGDHQVKKWAETVAEVNETCKQQRQIINQQRETINQARQEIARLDKVIAERKTDVINRFEAINILISSSIRDGNIGLAHWKRDERLHHLKDAVLNQIKDLRAL